MTDRKQCKNCGTSFTRQECDKPRARPMCSTEWIRRKYCSLKCSRQNGIRMNQWATGTYPNQGSTQ